jgi:hypothetical protein
VVITNGKSSCPSHLWTARDGKPPSLSKPPRSLRCKLSSIERWKRKIGCTACKSSDSLRQTLASCTNLSSTTGYFVIGRQTLVTHTPSIVPSIRCILNIKRLLGKSNELALYEYCKPHYPGTRNSQLLCKAWLR